MEENEEKLMPVTNNQPKNTKHSTTNSCFTCCDSSDTGKYNILEKR